MMELEKAFTAAYQSHISPALREAACLNALFPACLAPLQPGDMFAGRSPLMRSLGVGFSPDGSLHGYPQGITTRG